MDAMNRDFLMFLKRAMLDPAIGPSENVAIFDMDNEMTGRIVPLKNSSCGHEGGCIAPPLPSSTGGSRDSMAVLKEILEQSDCHPEDVNILQNLIMSNGRSMDTWGVSNAEMTFDLFSRLPPELRRRIWSFVMPKGRVIDVERLSEGGGLEMGLAPPNTRFKHVLSTPAMTAACSESRKEAQFLGWRQGVELVGKDRSLLARNFFQKHDIVMYRDEVLERQAGTPMNTDGEIRCSVQELPRAIGATAVAVDWFNFLLTKWDVLVLEEYPDMAEFRERYGFLRDIPDLETVRVSWLRLPNSADRVKINVKVEMGEWEGDSEFLGGCGVEGLSFHLDLSDANQIKEVVQLNNAHVTMPFACSDKWCFY